MLLNALIYHNGYQCLIQVQLHLNIHQYLLIPTTPFKICQLHIRMLSSSHSKCHSHMRPRNLHIAPTQNMSSTYNAKETIYLAPTQFHVKHVFSIFWTIPKSFDQISNWDFYLRDTSIHTVFKTCPLYQLQPFLKQIFKKSQFWQLNFASKLPIGLKNCYLL